MTSWLRDHGLTLLLILAGIGAVSGWTRAAHYEGMAEAHEQEKERAKEDAEASARRATASAQRAAEAERETERVKAQSAQRIASLTAELRDLSQTNATLEAAAEAEIREHDGWISEATYRERVAGLERIVALRTAESAEKDVIIEAQDAEINVLKVQVSDLLAHGKDDDEVIAAQDRQIIALEAAQSSGGILPDFGSLTRPLYVAVGIGVGYLAWKVR